MAGDEAVAVGLLLRHAEVAGAVGDKLVGLFEAAFIEQKFDALTRRHLALFVLAFAALRAAAVFGELVALLQFCELLFAIHREEIIAGGKGRGVEGADRELPSFVRLGYPFGFVKGGLGGLSPRDIVTPCWNPWDRSGISCRRSRPLKSWHRRQFPRRRWPCEPSFSLVAF